MALTFRNVSVLRPTPWELAAEPPGLAVDEVHVWCADLHRSAAELARLGAVLAPDELARGRRLRGDRLRERFIAARGLLRTILAGYLRVHPQVLVFAYGTRGKPGLVATDAPVPLQFNLSHSKARLLLAVARSGAVGVDIEQVQPHRNVLPLAERFFAADEARELRALPEPLQARAFYACWARKEAVLKALGEGLARSLHSFRVSVDPAQPARLLAIQGEGVAPAQWSLRDLAPAPDYAAALAVPWLVAGVRCLRWASGGRCGS